MSGSSDPVTLKEHHDGQCTFILKDTSRGDFAAVGRFDDWRPLARDAYKRLADGFEALDPDDWERPTPREGWTVRDLGGHLVGAMRGAARLQEMMS